MLNPKKLAILELSSEPLYRSAINDQARHYFTCLKLFAVTLWRSSYYTYYACNQQHFLLYKYYVGCAF